MQDADKKIKKIVKKANALKEAEMKQKTNLKHWKRHWYLLNKRGLRQLPISFIEFCN